MPMTLDHPPGDETVAPDNFAKYSTGSVGSPVRDGDFVRADILITRKDAIAALAAGKNQLSCGYTLDLISRSGVIVHADGREERFDAIQTNIIGNHVAQVDVARAGPEARIRIDEADVFDVASPHTRTTTMEFEDVVINGKTYRVTKDAAEQMRKDGVIGGGGGSKSSSQDDTQHRQDVELLRKMTAERDELRGRMAVLEAEKKKSEEDAQNAKRSDADTTRVRERIELIAKAQPILNLKTDELLALSDVDIMRRAVETEKGIRLDGANADVLRGAFAMLTARVDTADSIQAIVNRGRDSATQTREDADPGKAIRDAQARMQQRDMNAWKPKELRDAEKAS